MNQIALRDRIFMNQPHKFQINNVDEENKKIMDYALSNYEEGILYFSSKLNQDHRKKVCNYLEKNYPGYGFCDMNMVNCLELGFSKLNLGAKKYKLIEGNKNA